jgi:glycosyltransferase involved in cell wall biosynthesis
MAMDFTLAICTYNRAALLAGALESLATCEPPRGEWELLLVDNNSSDDTARVAQAFAQRLPLRYVHEPVQGLSSARNRALRECEGDVLLFTDDDLRFDADWLRSWEDAFAKQADAGWFGGRIRPLWPDGPPAWLHDESLALISGLLVRYDLGEKNRAYTDSDPTPYGASFALRRAAFERNGGFRTDLGVNGDRPGRGEEADYLERLSRMRVPGYYVGESSAWHVQQPRRFGWRYLYRYGVEKGIAEAALSAGMAKAPPPWRQVMFAAKAAVQLLKGRGDRARQCVINMGIVRGLGAARRTRETA